MTEKTFGTLSHVKISKVDWLWGPYIGKNMLASPSRSAHPRAGSR